MIEGYERGPVLIDTEVLIWAVAAPERLSPLARHVCESADHEVCVSVASLWEILIKVQSNKWQVEDPINWYMQWTEDLRHLAINIYDVIEIGGLPQIHKDPFDRILIAQALQNKMPLVSCDQQIRRYPKVHVVW